MKNRSRARGWALQALYAWEQRGAAAEMGMPVLQDLFASLRVSPANRPYAEILVRLVGQNLEKIDRTIVEALTNWRLERLAVVDRNILRLGVFELLEGAVPPKVAIDEALWLAHRFGGTQTAGFVNGVLDSVARSLGRL